MSKYKKSENVQGSVSSTNTKKIKRNQHYKKINITKKN